MLPSTVHQQNFKFLELKLINELSIISPVGPKIFFFRISVLCS